MTEQKLQDLPIGIQTFEELRNNNFLYVDKTQKIYEIARTKTPCFLSRPRRFGKSLLCTTLKALFEGKKHLFEGTWIASSAWQWQEHPVIHLDFNKIEYKTPAGLEKELCATILVFAKQYNIELNPEQLPGTLLHLLITSLTVKGKPLPVVLIDEYDKPITNNLHDVPLLDKYREVLYNCYSPLKSLDANLRFLFITGVSQFSKVSIFSALNHLKILTDDITAATICGYTEAELENSFKDYIEKAAKVSGCSSNAMIAEIRQWYDGYCFMDPAHAPERLYNPFSIINFFDSVRNGVVDFKNHWFKSGTPSFVIEYFKKHHFKLGDFQDVKASREVLDSLMPGNLNLKTIMFQTGYLTIKERVGTLFALQWPNEEVARSCAQGLLDFALHLPGDELRECADELHALFKQNVLTEVNLMETLKKLCAFIPSTIAPDDEKDYQFMFWLVLKLVGLPVEAEKPTSVGRLDLAFLVGKQAFVIELKIRGKADKAIKQIIDRRYAEQFVARKLKVTSIGIVFDIATRTVTSCAVMHPDGVMHVLKAPVVRAKKKPAVKKPVRVKKPAKKRMSQR